MSPLTAVLAVLSAIIGRLPPEARVRSGRVLGFLAGRVLRIRRGPVEQAMDRAGIADAGAVATRMYEALGIGVVELLGLARAPHTELREAIAAVEIDPEATRALDEALSRGPVVLLASHTGNWELAAAAAGRLLADRGRKLFVVAKAMHARGVDAFLGRLRERLGVYTIAPRGAVRSAQRALGAGDVVVMPIDQVPDHAAHGLPVRFLGERALADRAPATIACRAGATALVVAAEHSPRVGSVRVRLLTTIPPRGQEGAEAWIERSTVEATRCLEAFVLRSPEAWLWLHRRWREPRAASLLVATQEPS